MSERGVETWADWGDRWIASFDLYVVARAYSALGGLIAVAAVYATARRLAGPRAAAASGLLTAVALPMVQHAHYATTSSLAAGFGAVAVWGCVEALYRVRRTPRTSLNRFQRVLPGWGWAFLIAGVAAGLAAGSRYNAAGLALVNALSGLLILRGPGGRGRTAVVLAGWLAIPAVFILTTPHILFDPQEVWPTSSTSPRSTGAARAPAAQRIRLVYEVRYLVLYGIGIPAAVLAVVSALVPFTATRSAPRRPTRRAVVANPVLYAGRVQSGRPAHAAFAPPMPINCWCPSCRSSLCSPASGWRMRRGVCGGRSCARR